MNVKIIGIAGGTASGKTTLAERLHDLASSIGNINIIKLDNYYIDRSHLSSNEREDINYDHPSAFDVSLLKNHIISLKNNRSIEMPTYNFDSHTRNPKTITVFPTKVVIIEGIMVLALEEIKDLIDFKIYVDTADDIRFIRRLKRDIEERGRTLQSVIKQYLESVKPMHEAFVLPSKVNAHIIIPEGGMNEVAIQIISNTIISLVNN